MKRLLSLIMALCLLLAGASMTAFAENTEPEPLTMFYSSSRSMNDLTYQTAIWAKENLGIDMQLTQGSSEWKQQLALYMSDGSMPDLVAFMDEVTFRTYAEMGAWYDITEYIEKSDNIKAYVAAQSADPDKIWSRMSVGDKIYGVPYMGGMKTQHLLSYRQDWLENLGLDVPETLDDLTEVMRAFTFDDPDGNGVDDTYGYGQCEGLAYLTGFFGPFGTTPLEYTLLNDEGKLVTAVISDEFRAALEYMRDIYAEGLVDPEMFTMTAEQRYQDWVLGKFGIQCTTWTNPGNSINRYGFFDSNPTGKIGFIMPVTGDDGQSGHIARDELSSVVAISKDSQHVDAAMRLIECQSTYEGYITFYMGPSDQFHTLGEDGKINWAWTVEGKDKYGNELTDMEIYKILGNNPIQNEITMLKQTAASEVQRGQIEYVANATYYPDVFFGVTTEESLKYGSEATKYYTEATIRFITGEMDIDTEWDAYVEGYLENGGEAVRQSKLEAYNETNGTNYVFAY